MTCEECGSQRVEVRGYWVSYYPERPDITQIVEYRVCLDCGHEEEI